MEKKPDLNFLTLAFQGSQKYLEDRFMQHYNKNSIVPFRISLVIGFFAYSLYGIHDYFILPRYLFPSLLAIRFKFVAVAAVICFILTYLKSFYKILQPTAFAAMFSAGLGLELIIFKTPQYYGFTVYPGYIIVIMSCFVILRLRFIYASLCSLLLLIIYNAVAFMNIIHSAIPILLVNNINYIVATLIGMYACYYMEYSARKNYYYSVCLDSQCQKLAEFNRKLETTNEELKTISAKDPLTQLFNRHSMEKAFNDAWELGKKENRPCSMILCDIDYFKKFNDTCGHFEGDKCLKKVAFALRLEIRRNDFIARYGGEEFVIVLAACDRERAWFLADKMRRSVEMLKINHPASDISSYVTMSFGVATIDDYYKYSHHDLFKMADKALYKAKNNGRNRVECYSESDNSAAS